MNTPVYKLLGEYTTLLNTFGTASPEACEYLAKHANNDDFKEMADIIRRLKVVLNSPSADSLDSYDHRCAR